VSSIHGKGTASLAVDGDRNSELGALSCFRTKNQKGAWWRVDLQAVYVITQVIITNANLSGELEYDTDLKSHISSEQVSICDYMRENVDTGVDHGRRT